MAGIVLGAWIEVAVGAELYKAMTQGTDSESKQYRINACARPVLFESLYFTPNFQE